jgi:two-component system cell cycle response regulator
MNTPKILSVDDSRMVQTIVAKTFEHFDTRLIFASDGAEALAVAARELPDLIILDVTMPVMDGFEALTRLKADPALKGIPVIMLTAEAGMDNVMRIAKLGVRDYVVKPFTKEGLLERVQRVLPLREKAAGEAVAKTVEDNHQVLVLDENPEEHAAVQAAFQDFPWTIHGCTNPREAAEYALKTAPDLCLVSLSLPNRMAQNFLHAIRSDERLRRVPVLGLSVPAAIAVQAEASSAGFAGIVMKPLEADRLVEVVLKTLKLDPKLNYFSVEDGVCVARFPAQLDAHAFSTLRHEFNAVLSKTDSPARGKIVLDLNSIFEADLHLIEFLVRLDHECRSRQIQTRTVSSDDFAAKARCFAETAELTFYKTRAEALAA